MVKVFIEFFLAFRRRSQSGTGSNTEFAGIDEVEHTVLDNFGVNGEVFEVGVYKAVDNCVSNEPTPDCSGSRFFGRRLQQLLF